MQNLKDVKERKSYLTISWKDAEARMDYLKKNGLDPDYRRTPYGFEVWGREINGETAIMDDLYIQEIKCEKCKKLIGYAPYFREAYQCLDCHSKIQHEWAKDCKHDWSWGPTEDIDTCYDCLSTRPHVPRPEEGEEK